MVGNNTIHHPTFHQVVGYIAFARVHKQRHEVTTTIKFGHGVELVLIEEALHQRAVDLLADTALCSTFCNPNFPATSPILTGVRPRITKALPREILCSSITKLIVTKS